MKKISILAVLSLALAASARAEGDSGAAKDSAPKSDNAAGPCAEDSAKLCPDMKPGDGKWGPCMKEHKDQVSQACKDKMEAGKEKMKGKMQEKAQDACGADGDKFCSGMKPGDGKWGRCLKEHKADLSPACKKFMAGMKNRRGRWKKNSGGDSQPQDDGDSGE